MYVCLCMGVTDREVRDAVNDGAASVPEVMECCGAGTRCGSCRPAIAAMIEHVAPRVASPPPSTEPFGLQLISSLR